MALKLHKRRPTMKLVTPQPLAPAPVVTVFLRPSYGIRAGQSGLEVCVRATPVEKKPARPAALKVVEA